MNRQQHGHRARLALLLPVLGALVVGCGPSPAYYVEDAPVVEHDGYEDRRGSLVGRWTGVGRQSDGGRWEIELDVARTDEGPCAVVRYPDLGCSGFWTCVPADKAYRLEAVETITEGQERCMGDVPVSVVLGPTGRDAMFDACTDEVTANARLVRTEQD
jgi:hypothetical protein